MAEIFIKDTSGYIIGSSNQTHSVTMVGIRVFQIYSQVVFSSADLYYLAILRMALNVSNDAVSHQQFIDC